MSLHDILITVQYACVIILFVESWIVFANIKTKLHTYLLFSCLSMLICNMGYLMEMKAVNAESFLTALKFSYAGRTWITFSFFLFTTEFCMIRVPKWFKNALILFLVFVYGTILTVEKHNLYYDGYDFISDGDMLRFIHGNGIVHHVYIILQALIIMVVLGLLINNIRNEKAGIIKMRGGMLVAAFTVQGGLFLFEAIGPKSVTGLYDFNMLGCLMGSVLMLIAIFRFDLLGTREIAKEFVIDRISEGIIAVDTDNMIRYYNEPAARLYPELRKGITEVPKVIAKAVSDKGSITIGERILSPEENDLVYNRQVVGKLYALVDDTEHFRYMEELEKQKEIADNANEAKSRFLANMSHEIRTPINAVLGMDEMILRESKEKTTRSYAADIMSAGKTLLSIINDILDLSKVEEGKMEIIPVEYDLSSLINDLSNMIRDRAAKKGLLFNINVNESIPHVLCGDEVRIRQCVMNLLTNGVKYTEEGSVTLNVFFEKKDEDHISLGFSVADTGMGMKEEDLEKLFAPYQRIEEKRNRNIEGTGLGMSITRELLLLMGSSLDVQSEYGKGSVFTFCVEQEVLSWDEIGDIAKKISEAERASYEYHELFHAPDAHILVVDDTEMNLTVIKSLLKNTRIQIDTAASGLEALSLTSDNKYDAIFIDHMMPDMDGIETLKHMREEGQNTETPAVALTANAVTGAREMYLEAGFGSYLSKPVEGGKLEALLKELLPEDKLLEPSEDMGSDTGDEASEDASGADSPDISETGLPAWLKECVDIDVAEGIRNCGNPEGYMAVLEIFYQTVEEKADEIQGFYDSEDWENYTIKVHALKSSARVIGVSDVSKLAESLEMAGKEGNIDYIRKNTGKLLTMYRELEKILTPLDEREGNGQTIDRSAIKEAYQTIIEIAGSVDYALMDELLSSLREYELPYRDREIIGRIEMCLTRLDWEGIEKAAKDALEEE